MGCCQKDVKAESFNRINIVSNYCNEITMIRERRERPRGSVAFLPHARVGAIEDRTRRRWSVRFATSGRTLLINRSCVVQIERERVWAGFELDGLTPDQTLIVVARGDHQVVGSGGHAWKGSAAVGVGANG